MSDWFASLWRALVHEDGDEWVDLRRGRGGTPSGARDMRAVERGREQEMEIVLKSPASSSGANARRAGEHGYFFGDDVEDDATSIRASPSTANVTTERTFSRSNGIPAKFPGLRVEVTGEGKMDEDAATVQRLWGDPGVFANAEDCRSIIRSLNEAEDVWRAMDQRLARWALRMKIYGANGEAFTREETLEFWRERARDLCDVFLSALLRVGGRFESCATTPRHREALTNVVEGYVMGGLQKKLLNGGVGALYAEEDAFTARRFERIKALPVEALGLHASCEDAITPTLIACIETLPQLSCPTHMAHRVADVARRVGSAATSADDLLAIFLVLIARASLPRAFSLVKYIETFHALISNAHKGEKGFTLANFSSAVHYARSEHVNALLAERGIPDPSAIANDAQ